MVSAIAAGRSASSFTPLAPEITSTGWPGNARSPGSASRADTVPSNGARSVTYSRAACASSRMASAVRRAASAWSSSCGVAAPSRSRLDRRSYVRRATTAWASARATADSTPDASRRTSTCPWRTGEPIPTRTDSIVPLVLVARLAVSRATTRAGICAAPSEWAAALTSTVPAFSRVSTSPGSSRVQAETEARSIGSNSIMYRFIGRSRPGALW